MFPKLLFSQVFCSKYIPTVFFGPNNVIVKKNINPAAIYIKEIENGLDSLMNLPSNNERTLEIEVLKSMKADWTQTIHSIGYQLNLDFEVTEFFSLSRQSEIFNKFSKHIPNNCLYNNPQDCISYYLLKKNKVEIFDDYGNKLIEGFHDFYNVGLKEHNNEIRFYRNRNLKSK